MVGRFNRTVDGWFNRTVELVDQDSRGLLGLTGRLRVGLTEQ